MGDMAEGFRALTQARKDRHAKWHKENIAIIEKAGIAYKITNYGETALFRGKVKADFYPSTGRWRSEGKTYSGGAKAFLEWWKRRRHNE